MKSRLKIAVYSMSKNEEKFVDPYMDSAKDADFITVADTGSTDYTVETLKTKAIRLGKSRQFAVHNISVDPWRFDTARNVALALVPADIDVCVRLDMDEVLDPGWREALERAWQHPVTQLWFDYKHSPGYSFRSNTIHARNGFLYRGLDHEGLYTAPGTPAISAYAPGLSITHHQDRTKPRTSILGRLQLAVLEDKGCRPRYYLGREYYYYKQHQSCIITLGEYLKLPDATWDAERMDAMCMIAESHWQLRQIPQAIEWYYRAIAEYPTREPYLGLSNLLYQINNKELALGMVQQALRFSNKMTSIYVKPAAWDERPFFTAARYARELGWEERACIYEEEGKRRTIPTTPIAEKVA